MQLRFIAISVVCYSAALLSACGGAPGTALTSRSDASAMSKAGGRYDSSSRNDKDDCDESEDHDASSHSLSVKSDDDDKECKSSDDYSGGSKDWSSRSLSVSSSSSSSSSKDDDDDANCKVTICHIPPGNHCNEHTIRVGKSAVRAHIAHGDYPGKCDAAPPPPPPPPPPPAACLPDTTACTLSADCCSGVCMLNGTCGIPG